MKRMNLQLFAEPTGGAGGTEPPAGGKGQQTPPATGQQTGQASPPQIDYAKIQTMLEGTLAAKEDTALKAYFKQQGLSQGEVEQAMLRSSNRRRLSSRMLEPYRLSWRRRRPRHRKR